MANFLAWSHSRRKTYNDCPKQLYHTAIARKGTPDHIPFEQTQQMRDGNAVDEALTLRISKGTPLPAKYAPYEPICQMVLDAPGTKLTQARYAFDQTWKQCGSMEWDRVWLRVIYDLAIVNGAHAFLWDWKDGKVYPNDDQLALFAGTAFLLFPEVEVVDTSYVWLRYGVTSDKKYHRRDAPEIWASLLPDVDRMQASFAANHWPAEPKNGARTCAYCSVNKAGKCDRPAGPYKGS